MALVITSRRRPPKSLQAALTIIQLWPLTFNQHGVLLWQFWPAESACSTEQTVSLGCCATRKPGMDKLTIALRFVSRSFSFGAPAAQQPAAPTSAPSFSFGNPSTTAPAAQPSTSLFGQPSQQQQQQGQAGQAPAGQAGGTSLFGGGFGASTSQQTQQQQPAPAGGFSFGGFGAKPAGTTPGTTPAPTGGLFGNTQPQQQQQPSFGFGACVGFFIEYVVQAADKDCIDPARQTRSRRRACHSGRLNVVSL